MLSREHIGLAGSFGALLVGGFGARAVSCKIPIYQIKFTIIAMYLIISDMDLNGLGKLLLDSDSGYHIAMVKIHRSSWNSCMKCFRDIFVKCKFDVHFHIRCFCNISTILWKWSSKSRFLKKYQQCEEHSDPSTGRQPNIIDSSRLWRRYFMNSRFFEKMISGNKYDTFDCDHFQKVTQGSLSNTTQRIFFC